MAVILTISMVTLVACAGSCEACGETSGVRTVSVEGDREALCNECIRDLDKGLQYKVKGNANVNCDISIRKATKQSTGNCGILSLEEELLA